MYFIDVHNKNFVRLFFFSNSGIDGVIDMDFKILKNSQLNFKEAFKKKEIKVKEEKQIKSNLSGEFKVIIALGLSSGEIYLLYHEKTECEIIS